jgi:cell division inhibitor SulA|tara:strand:- start:128 stop:475 length:348 start_codon:yes stop_codon:yes gene_type:complete
MASTKTMRAIDRLRKAANLQATRKEVTLSDGTVFEMWVTPLTLAERERAQKGIKLDDANEFALRLLMSKAQDETGQKLFQLGEIDVLKNEVRDSDLQKLMLSIIQEEEEQIDPKD